MLIFAPKLKQSSFFKSVNIFIIAVFLSTSLGAPVQANAQGMSFLPEIGAFVPPSNNYTPPVIKGIKIFPDNPLRFDFIVDTGNWNARDQRLEPETKKLVNYFLAALTVPDEEQWVNLSPYENDRIIPDEFSQTEMGRDLLAQDYLLKQLTASFIHPQHDLGEEFWQRVYDRAYEMYGTTDIPVNTFNKVWIIPEKAVVYESGQMAFIIESRLKVLLESDYLALKNNLNNEQFDLDVMGTADNRAINDFSSEIFKNVILPEIEKEVNQGENFIQLRQIYNSLILAAWYKRNLKESIINQVYSQQNKIKGIDIEDKQVREKIYNQYVEAFRAGIVNFVKEDYDPQAKRVIPRKYFSGGALFGPQQIDDALSVETRPEDQIMLAVEDTTEGGLTTASVSLEPVRNLNRLLRILRLGVKPDATEAQVMETLLTQLRNQGLIASENTDEDTGVKVVELKKEAKEKRLGQAIVEWVMSGDVGTKAINFYDTKGDWYVMGFEDEVDDELDHEFEEIALRKKGYNWIEAHNLTVARQAREGDVIIEDPQGQQLPATTENIGASSKDKRAREKRRKDVAARIKEKKAKEGPSATASAPLNTANIVVTTPAGVLIPNIPLDQALERLTPEGISTIFKQQLGELPANQYYHGKIFVPDIGQHYDSANGTLRLPKLSDKSQTQDIQLPANLQLAVAQCRLRQPNRDEVEFFIEGYQGKNKVAFHIYWNEVNQKYYLLNPLVFDDIVKKGRSLGFNNSYNIVYSFYREQDGVIIFKMKEFARTGPNEVVELNVTKYAAWANPWEEFVVENSPEMAIGNLPANNIFVMRKPKGSINAKEEMVSPITGVAIPKKNIREIAAMSPDDIQKEARRQLGDFFGREHLQAAGAFDIANFHQFYNPSTGELTLPSLDGGPDKILILLKKIKILGGTGFFNDPNKETVSFFISAQDPQGKLFPQPIYILWIKSQRRYYIVHPLIVDQVKHGEIEGVEHPEGTFLRTEFERESNGRIVLKLPQYEAIGLQRFRPTGVVKYGAFRDALFSHKPDAFVTADTPEGAIENLIDDTIPEMTIDQLASMPPVEVAKLAKYQERPNLAFFPGMHAAVIVNALGPRYNPSTGDLTLPDLEDGSMLVKLPKGLTITQTDETGAIFQDPDKNRITFHITAQDAGGNDVDLMIQWVKSQRKYYVVHQDLAAGLIRQELPGLDNPEQSILEINFEVEQDGIVVFKVTQHVKEGNGFRKTAEKYMAWEDPLVAGDYTIGNSRKEVLKYYSPENKRARQATRGVVQELVDNLQANDLLAAAARYAVPMQRLIWAILPGRLQGNFDEGHIRELMDSQLFRAISQQAQDDVQQTGTGGDVAADDISQAARFIEEMISRSTNADARPAAVSFIRHLEEDMILSRVYQQNPNITMDALIARVTQERDGPNQVPIVREALDQILTELNQANNLSQRLPENLFRALKPYQLLTVLRIINRRGVILADAKKGMGRNLTTYAAFIASGEKNLFFAAKTNIDIERFKAEIAPYLVADRNIAYQTYDELQEIGSTGDRYGFVALDDAHLLNKSDNPTTQAVFGIGGNNAIRANFKVLMTDTPVENRVSDMLSLLQYIVRDTQPIDPQEVQERDRLLGLSTQSFGVLFRTTNLARLSILHGILSKRMIRHARQVASQIPQINRTTVLLDPVGQTMHVEGSNQAPVVLDGDYTAQMELHQRAVTHPAEFERAAQSIGVETPPEAIDTQEEGYSPIVQFGRLRQIASDPNVFRTLVPDNQDQEIDSIKFDAALEIIKERLRRNQSVIVTSAFRKTAEHFQVLLGQALAADPQFAGTQVAYVHGGVSGNNRTAALQRFQNGEAKVLIAVSSLETMPVALTTTDVIVMIDYPDKPSDQNRIIDWTIPDVEPADYTPKDIELVFLNLAVGDSIDPVLRGLNERKSILDQMIVKGNLTPAVLAAFHAQDLRRAQGQSGARRSRRPRNVTQPTTPAAQAVQATTTVPAGTVFEAEAAPQAQAQAAPEAQAAPTQPGQPGPGDGAAFGSVQKGRDKVGGIDFNQQLLEIESQGGDVRFDLRIDPSFLQEIQIDGFNPIIINIAPVTNLPLLFGLDDSKTPTQELSLSDLRG